MRRLSYLAGATLMLICLAAHPAAAQGKPELWNGSHWQTMSQEIKVAYIKGIGNMADFEVAAGGAGRGPCISRAFVEELKNLTITQIIQEVDKFYQDHPEQRAMPVIEVVLRRCTKLCPPEAPAKAAK
ncbi:MAG: hypothetical protein K6T55_00780 [Syntrophobacterales bacterium]|nr:hypothetical protein [Syntrophobacterales bacterium]